MLEKMAAHPFKYGLNNPRKIMTKIATLTEHAVADSLVV